MVMKNIVIIGSGAAGSTAVLEAYRYTKNILLITKDSLRASNTYLAQGGIQAVYHPQDSYSVHAQDTLKAAGFTNDQRLVDNMIKNSRSVISWLEALGITFDREGERYRLIKTSGCSFPRLLSSGEYLGRHIVNALIKEIKSQSIPYQEYWEVANIEKERTHFLLTVITKERQHIRKKIKAKYLIVASGGGAFSYAKEHGLFSTNLKTADGKILKILESLGVKLVNQDSFQLHPTGSIYPKQLIGYPVPEAVRAYKARLLNKNMERFVDENLTREKVSQAIIKEYKKGNAIIKDNRAGVWLDLTLIDKQMGKGFTKDVFPKLYHKYFQVGIDITKELILVYPIVHYQNGGVKINTRCQTSIKGVFAAGEVTGGIHGVNRLMGNSLLDTFVFGRKAGGVVGKLCV